MYKQIEIALPRYWNAEPPHQPLQRWEAVVLDLVKPTWDGRRLFSLAWQARLKFGLGPLSTQSALKLTKC